MLHRNPGLLEQTFDACQIPSWSHDGYDERFAKKKLTFLHLLVRRCEDRTFKERMDSRKSYEDVFYRFLKELSVERFLTRQDSEGDTPLHAALKCTAITSCYNLPSRLIKRLIKKSGPALCKQNKHGDTPLNLALMGWRRDKDVLVEYLMEKEPMALNFRDRYENTVLHLWCPRLQQSLVEQVIQMYPRLLSERDKEGRTALHIACSKNRRNGYRGTSISHCLGVLKGVKENCPNVFQAQDDNGFTPLRRLFADCRPRDEILSIAITMIEYGPFTLSLRNCHGWTPLESMIRSFRMTGLHQPYGLLLRKHWSSVHALMDPELSRGLAFYPGRTYRRLYWRQTARDELSDLAKRQAQVLVRDICNTHSAVDVSLPPAVRAHIQASFPHGCVPKRVSRDRLEAFLDNEELQSWIVQEWIHKLIFGIHSMNTTGRRSYLKNDMYNRRKGVKVIASLSKIKEFPDNESLDAIYWHVREIPMSATFKLEVMVRLQAIGLSLGQSSL